MGAAAARIVLTAVLIVLISTAFTACRATGDERRTPAASNLASILLFKGTGASPGEVTALEKILSSEHFNY